MLYSNAFQQDIQATGRIRCSFVVLYDETGKPLFSFQASKFYGRLCSAKYTPLKSDHDLIPVTLTDEAAAVLESYAKQFLSKKQRLNEIGISLMKHFDADYRLTDKIFFIAPNAIDWTPVEIVAPEPGQPGVKLTKKTKITLIAAAALALLSN